MYKLHHLFIRLYIRGSRKEERAAQGLCRITGEPSREDGELAQKGKHSASSVLLPCVPERAFHAAGRGREFECKPHSSSP
jgi:hypothetical protein